MLNLAVNGRDAMPDGGVLTIFAHNLLDVEVPADLPPGQYVAIGVRDAGEGMAPDVLAKAQEAFFTTKPQGKGTGLGLPMVRDFARQSGGALRISSTRGTGTTVEIILPRAAMVTSTPERAAAVKVISAPRSTSNAVSELSRDGRVTPDGRGMDRVWRDRDSGGDQF